MPVKSMHASIIWRCIAMMRRLCLACTLIRQTLCSAPRNVTIQWGSLPATAQQMQGTKRDGQLAAGARQADQARSVHTELPAPGSRGQQGCVRLRGHAIAHRLMVHVHSVHGRMPYTCMYGLAVLRARGA